MNTPHTPGPWKTETGMIYTKDGRLLAKVFAERGNMVLAEAEANAHLIASAPTLLSQRNELRVTLQACVDMYAIVAPLGDSPVIAQARAALANAKD